MSDKWLCGAVSNSSTQAQNLHLRSDTGKQEEGKKMEVYASIQNA